MGSVSRGTARGAAVAAAFGCLVIGAVSAQAQSGASGTATNNGAPAEPNDTYEIVVTAQRRSELSRDVPISIVSVSGDQLDKANVEQLSDIGKVTPGVRFRGQSTFLQPSIRGVSTSLVGSGVGSNVGIYVDGFYASTAAGSNFQLLNIQNIQVLKGPQGTLFGRNTTGGAILVTTAEPSTETSATVEASYERYNAQRYQAYATTGLTSGIAIDVEGLFSKGDNYFRNIVPDGKNGEYQNWAIRTGLKAQLSPAVSVLLRYEHSDTDDPSFVESNALVENGTPLTIGTFVPGTVIATRPGEVAQSPDEPVSFNARTNIAQMTVEADLGFAKLTSLSQYRQESTLALSDLDYTSADIAYLRLPQSVKIFTQEVLLASRPGPPLQWTVGAFFLNQKDSYPQSDLSISGGPFLLTAATGLTTRSFAFYGDATYQLADTLFLTAGLRFTRELQLDAFRFSGPLTGDLGLTSYPTLAKNYLTPRVVLRYKPSENSSVYASFTQGSKAGIIDTNDSNPNARIKPEKLTSYEVGFKRSSRRFSLDLSAYYYNYKDLQVSIPVGTALLVRNAASSRIYGAEAQVHYDFGSGFEVTGGVAYSHARYRNFPTSQVFLQCLDFATCGANFGTFPNSTSDSSGFHMQLAPDFTANLAPNYTFGLAGGKVNLSANFYYTSSYYLDTSQQFRQGSYATLDVRAEWTDRSERYTFAVYGSNVTDKRYLSQAGPNNFAIGALWSVPAIYGASVRAKF